MSFSNKAAAAFRELHHRLKSLEETVQGSVESDDKVAFIEQRVSSSGALSVGRETRR